VELQTADGARRLDFKQCIIAPLGVVRLPGFPDDRDIDSTVRSTSRTANALVIAAGLSVLNGLCVRCPGRQGDRGRIDDGLMRARSRSCRPLQKRIESATTDFGQDQGGELEPTAPVCAHFEAGCAGAAGVRRVLVSWAAGNATQQMPRGRRGWTARNHRVDKQCDPSCPYIRHRRHRGARAGAKATHEAKVAAEVAPGTRRIRRAVIPSVPTRSEVAWWVTETRPRSASRIWQGHVSVAARRFSPSIATKGSPSSVRQEDSTRHRRRNRRHQRGELMAEVGLRSEMVRTRRTLDLPLCAPTSRRRWRFRGSLRRYVDGSVHSSVAFVAR